MQDGKNVDFTITGVSEGERIVTRGSAIRTRQGDSDIIEGLILVGDEKQPHKIVITGNRIEVDRNYGQTVMIYEPGEEIEFDYNTPKGALRLAMYTNDVEIAEDKSRLNIRIAYELRSFGECLSNNILLIEVDDEGKLNGQNI